MIEVLTLGECMAMMYPTAPVPLDASPLLHLDIAGAESNLAIALARLGHPARFVTRVGADRFGDLIRATLAREGVVADGVIVDPDAPTGVFFREWLSDGERRVLYYRRGSAASRLRPEDLRPEWFAAVRYVHLTGITPALSADCARTCQHAITLARAAGARVSFDVNYRPRLWSPGEARATLLPLMRQADVLLLGHEDARAVLEASDDDAALRRATECGAGLVVLKRAERGALAWYEGRRWEVPAAPVDRLIDPVGAGDGFDAGLLAGLLRGLDLEAALALGARVGAACVSKLGDYQGYPRE
jgi:2-dehydro-3-deoxygluconokinase